MQGLFLITNTILSYLFIYTKEHHDHFREGNGTPRGTALATSLFLLLFIFYRPRAHTLLFLSLSPH